MANINLNIDGYVTGTDAYDPLSSVSVAGGDFTLTMFNGNIESTFVFPVTQFDLTVGDGYLISVTSPNLVLVATVGPATLTPDPIVPFVFNTNPPTTPTQTKVDYVPIPPGSPAGTAINLNYTNSLGSVNVLG